MICVTIGRGRNRTLLEEWKEAAAAGAELVELRIDCLRSEPDLKRILAQRFTPLVFTIRRGADGGLWRGDEEKRQRLFREAILAGVDYVDLEADVATKIPRYGKTKRIVSLHDMKQTPENLDEIVKQAREAHADIVKVATMAHSVADASRVLQLVAKAQAPTVGIAMGPLGVFTRVLGAKFGAPLTYAGFNPERIFAAGMIPFKEMKRDYEYDKIDAASEVYAVLGDPIGHSLSPALHNAAFRHLGLNKVYVPLQIPAGQLKESLAALAWLDIKGMSVTIPHKEAVVPLLTQKDGAVERIGACNTVVIKDKDWIGSNTDYRAAIDTLEATLGGSPHEGESPLNNKQALILGAGGVARSIAFGLARRGAGVSICNHNEDKAVKLAADVGCRHISWAMRAGTPCDVLVNCTPIGMHPNIDQAPVPPAAFREGMLVFDTVYHPENTLLIKLARERGCHTVTGVDMFVRQAALQFEQFTGGAAPVEVMREVVARKLGALRE